MNAGDTPHNFSIVAAFAKPNRNPSHRVTFLRLGLGVNSASSVRKTRFAHIPKKTGICTKLPIQTCGERCQCGAYLFDDSLSFFKFVAVARSEGVKRRLGRVLNGCIGLARYGGGHLGAILNICARGGFVSWVSDIIRDFLTLIFPYYSHLDNGLFWCVNINITKYLYLFLNRVINILFITLVTL